MKWVEFKLFDKNNDLLGRFFLEKWNPDLVDIIKYIDVYILSASFFAYYIFSQNKDSEYYWLSFYEILQDFIKWHAVNKEASRKLFEELYWIKTADEHWFRMEIDETELSPEEEKCVKKI